MYDPFPGQTFLLDNFTIILPVVVCEIVKSRKTSSLDAVIEINTKPTIVT